MMEFIVNNFVNIILAICVIITFAILVYNLVKHPGERDVEKVQEWLLWAVSVAELELGGGTGELKLRYVYDMFVEKFPTAITSFITFEMFSKMVDIALTKLEGLLNSNQQVKELIEDAGAGVEI